MECGDCVNMIQPVVLVIVLLVAGNNIVHGGSWYAQLDPNQGLEWNNSRCKSTVSLEWNNQGLETGVAPEYDLIVMILLQNKSISSSDGVIMLSVL